MKTSRKFISLLLTLAMLCGMLCTTGFAADENVAVTADSFVDGVYTISESGVYEITKGATGVIAIVTTDPVTISGPDYDESNYNLAASTTAFKGLSIYGMVPGVDLTIEDLFITEGKNYAEVYTSTSYWNIIHVTGSGNKLTLAGVNDLECGGGAVIHVPSDADLAIGGSGTLYLYKSGAWTCIGGNGDETNGSITINGGKIFAKGTKMGAVIGSGAYCADAPGDVTINGGVLNLIANARGAMIGNGAGGSYTSTGNVTINGGSVNINVDWTGAAIGASGSGSGPNEQNAADGSITINGGSLRVFIDYNSASKWGLTGAGVNSAGLTHTPVNEAGSELSMCEVPTDGSNAHTVFVDGELYYEGGLHEYCFVQETLEKQNQQTITTTISNWISNDDDNLYFYLTGEDHTIKVDGTTYAAAWDAETKTFSLTEEETGGSGWYGDGTASEYTISTADELAEFAAIVNGTHETFAQDTFQGKTVTLADDVDLSSVCGEESGSWSAIGGAAEQVSLTITSQEELNAALEEHNIIYDNTGMSYKYGTDKNLNYDSARTYYYVQGQIFSGTFDGAGHTISGLYVYSDTGYAGLFGNVDGSLKNFTVDGSVTVSTGTTEVDFVGGVTGKLSEGGRIERVTSNVDVDASSKAYNVGGIAGFVGTKDATASNPFTSADNTFVIECVNNGSVIGYSQVGGITGENAGQILRCVNTGTISCTKSSSKNGTAGIAGRNGCNNTAYTAGTIIDCYNTGEIGNSAAKWIGGITGFNNAASTVKNCYNVGVVHGIGQANALVGQNEGEMAKETGAYNSWYLDTTKVFDESGVYGGYYADCGKKTESEMKSDDFAILLGESYNVDSDNINSGYPVLAWQGGSKPSAGTTVPVEDVVDNHTGDANAVVTGPEGGFVVDGTTENTFTVSSTGDVACVVLVATTDDEGNVTYERLSANNADGVHSFTTALSEGQTIVVALKGDVSGDGAVTSRDAMMLNSIASGTLQATALQAEVGHIGSTDAISSRDAMMANTVAAGSTSLNW